ncbi:MAG: hypothetical protein HC820_09255 [Hydrococcus sp. RM1_1_31]|nr:hypothetical protein [Hydrococcus sp. RM1_1_31]
MIRSWSLKTLIVFIAINSFLFYFSDPSAIASLKQKNSETILAFETRNYAVKIYCQENRLLMDIYNKKPLI